MYFSSSASRVGSSGVALAAGQFLQVPLRFGRPGLELQGMTELGGCSLEIAPVECGTSFGDVEIGVLAALFSGHQFAAFLKCRRGFLLPASARQGEAKLVVGFTAGRLQPCSFLELRNRVGHLAVPNKRLAKRQVGTRERRRQVDHFTQLLDLFRWPAAGTGAVGECEVEVGLDRGRRQRHGGLELTNRFVGVGGGESRAQIGVRVRVVGPDAHGLAQGRDPRLVVACLYQHESETVVRFGEVRPQPNGLAELGRHRGAVGALATEQQTKGVVRVGPGRVGSQCLPESSDGGVPVRRRNRGRGEGQPGFELAQCLVHVAGPQIDDSRDRRRPPPSEAEGRSRAAGSPARRPDPRVHAGRFRERRSWRLTRDRA